MKSVLDADHALENHKKVQRDEAQRQRFEPILRKGPTCLEKSLSEMGLLVLIKESSGWSTASCP